MYGFTKLGFTFEVYSNNAEDGVEIYDAKTKRFITAIPWADIEELEYMRDEELEEWLDKKI